MDYKIIWTPDARGDLKKIYEFYSEKSRSAANRIVSDINSKTFLLISQPFIAAIEPLLEDDKREFRSLLAFKGKFKILYYVESDCVYIMYVWNCKQNPQRIRKRFS
jgi:Plasmid stabilization system protein